MERCCCCSSSPSSCFLVLVIVLVLVVIDIVVVVVVIVVVVVVVDAGGVAAAAAVTAAAATAVWLFTVRYMKSFARWQILFLLVKLFLALALDVHDLEVIADLTCVHISLFVLWHVYLTYVELFKRWCLR